MKLCVIGNSHVGMLRAAMRDHGADGPDITFFAKAGAGIENARVQGSVIAAGDPELRAAQARFGMPERVDVTDFDATIFVAGTASIYKALRILLDFRVSGWPSCRAAADAGASSGAEPSGRALISEPAFVAALTDLTRAGPSYRFARALSQASDGPMFVVPQPYPSERVFDSTRSSEFAFLRARKTGDGPAIAACLTRAIDLAFHEIDPLTVLHQPADTIAHGFATAHAFSRDAVRVDGDTAQHEADVLHVGPAYGKKVLAQVIASLRADAPCVICPRHHI